MCVLNAEWHAQCLTSSVMSTLDPRFAHGKQCWIATFCPSQLLNLSRACQLRVSSWNFQEAIGSHTSGDHLMHSDSLYGETENSVDTS